MTEETSPVSRRRLLATAGAVGITATAVAAGAIGVGAAGAGAASAKPAGTADVDLSDGPLVVHVRDLSSGALDVFHGTDHHQVTDPELAARLAAAIRS